MGVLAAQAVLFVALVTMLFPLWYMLMGALSPDATAPPGRRGESGSIPIRR